MTKLGPNDCCFFTKRSHKYHNEFSGTYCIENEIIKLNLLGD